MKYPLLENSDDNKRLLLEKDRCDCYDYLAAVGCGVAGGLIDIFLVGSPKDSVLGKWTDAQVDNTVMVFAKHLGWNPRNGNEHNVRSAISFLENGSSRSDFGGFRVNYDQSNSAQVDNLFKMSTNNHHMLSLAHSPDIIGLFFSILNQFTSTSSFIANGQVITIATDTFELQGNNFMAKIYCGTVNWFGHLMSDIAGSSKSKGRGTGIVMPFYELFGFLTFGKFNVENDKQDLATIATRVFQEGYDLRYGLAQTIPVVMVNLSIRLIWALRRYFQYGCSLTECIPSNKYEDLRVMLLWGNGTLCLMDGLDAGIRSGGNFLTFFMRLNLVAWFQFTVLVLKEIYIRVGISNALQKEVDAYKRINGILLQYLHELEKIDIQAFREQTEVYNQVTKTFLSVESPEELNQMLYDTYEKLDLHKPWKGDFNAHMANKKGKLIFE